MSCVSLKTSPQAQLEETGVFEKSGDPESNYSNRGLEPTDLKRRWKRYNREMKVSGLSQEKGTNANVPVHDEEGKKHKCDDDSSETSRAVVAKQPCQSP